MEIRWLMLAIAVAPLGCAPEGDTPVRAEPGAPLPGLSEMELARFEQGRTLFSRAFAPEEGLGPLFNQDRCSSCHDLPAVGGTGAEAALFATRFEPPDRCDLLREAGGNNIQQRLTPRLADQGVAPERIPPSANAIARVTPPSLFGLGLLEAIPDATLLAHADSDDADGDGISGRPGRTEDGRLGRFGRKAEFATVGEFVAGALLFEMGITSSLHPAEETLNGRLLPPGADPAADPEMEDRDLDLLTDFVRLLAPPAPAPPESTVTPEVLRQGERAFHAAGCAGCHIPAMRTARHANPVFDRRWVALYSDLLLHDLGPEASGHCGVGARPSEFRTAALVGLRHRTGLLHDGAAATVWGAVLRHGGEAAAARAAFQGFTARQRERLEAFLYSL
jgi:CxxC motif-containing protein (DUF1111 family)